MSGLVVWSMGTAAAVCAILGACGVYVWCVRLARRLPLAVYSERLSWQVAELEARRDLLQSEVDQLRLEKADLAAEIGEARSWLQQNQAKLEQLPAKRAEIEQIEEKLRQQQSALEELENATLEAKNRRLEEEEKSQQAIRAVEAARRELNDLQTLKGRLDAAVAALQQQQQELSNELLRQEVALRLRKAELDDLQKDVQAEEARLAEVRKQQQEAADARWEAEKLRAEALHERDRLVEEAAAKQKLLDTLRSTVEGLSQRVEAFQHAIEPPPAEKRLADFLRPVLAVPPDVRPISGRSAEEQLRLEACAEHIEKNGYRFHPRALRAFHTALKTADVCPLVVLAGISGTGKSQLPRLYAEAMGMHFLNVAVQPRWDAPQDLFGFYNYMEHSYKATELARALRQMDRVHWPAQSAQDKLVQHGILLVLLDEMNLARVEYYFSELLSKLEMRNALGDDGAAERGLADIEIEIGPLKQQDAARRLHVGGNVLFVGTMNEDETTQALSDKVLDRSNVLRFGKPEQLQPEKPPRQAPPAVYLPHQVWQGWLNSELPPAEREEFDKTFVALNKILVDIHRPFGHRVYQAMYRYVANYPRWVDGWFPSAMADQFEQKIIPRLRGLSRDLDEKAAGVLEQVGSLIERIGDPPLAEAFRRACDAPVFQWVGVQRGEAAE